MITDGFEEFLYASPPNIKLKLGVYRYDCGAGDYIDGVVYQDRVGTQFFVAPNWTEPAPIDESFVHHLQMLRFGHSNKDAIPCVGCNGKGFRRGGRICVPCKGKGTSPDPSKR